MELQYNSNGSETEQWSIFTFSIYEIVLQESKFSFKRNPHICSSYGSEELKKCKTNI